jgi:hypothetical protein
MITIRNTYFLSSVVLFLVLILGIGTRFYLRHRRREKYPYGKWDDLLKRLSSLDGGNLALIAHEATPEVLQADDDDQDLDPETLWQLMGGMRGLEAMEKNCDVLVDLAFYVQQWYPEALIIAEQLRLNAQEVRWHVERLKVAAKAGNGRTATADYLPRAVATYYRMTAAVLSLYEDGKLPGLAELQRAL